MSQSTPSKIKSTLFVIIYLIGMLLGTEVIVMFFEGSESVPSWVSNIFMILALLPVGYSFSLFIEAFKENK